MEEKAKKDVREHKTPNNIVIVSYHWGEESKTIPNKIQRELGRATIDAGADLVLGHHPLVLQGIEKYKGKNIVYSLGNFSFGGNNNPKDKDSMIYQEIFQIQNGKIIGRENKIIPVRISSSLNRNDYRPMLLEGMEYERVYTKIENLNKKVN